MRTSRIFWSLLLLFLSLTAAARAQGDRDSLAAATTDPLTVQTAGGNSLAAVEQVWDAANTAYINSDYHRAIDAYRQLILRGYASDKLYYNLANAYFKVGRYGKAILYYNRALRLAPGDADIRYNPIPSPRTRSPSCRSFSSKAGCARCACRSGVPRGASSRWRRWRCSSRSCCFTCWPEGWRGARRVSTVRWRCCSFSSPPLRSP